MIPGEIILNDAAITINEGRPVVNLKVTNSGDRPVQVGSHIHFFEVNDRLSFDRKKAYGYRLDIASGTAVRFEARETKEVQLVAIGGRRKIYGANGRVQGYLNEKPVEEVK